MSQNYKDTLSLPRTDFPMKANLPAREPEMLRNWEETRLYDANSKVARGQELFVLHDGPPFANGDVHMGTALNKILKDFVVKSQTMLGKRAPYVPGWDCHGLPIEYKVVKESRELSPLEIRKRCEAFARKFIDIQREQFKRLGVFGDWEHPYLTMDPRYEAEILRAFAVFVEEGLVYEAQKPVFWSTGAQTALAEAEVEYQERDDTAVYVKFPIIGRARPPAFAEASAGKPDALENASIAIWTTTPWTLPANLAIAVDAKENYVVQNFREMGFLKRWFSLSNFFHISLLQRDCSQSENRSRHFPERILKESRRVIRFWIAKSRANRGLCHHGLRHWRGAHRTRPWRRRLRFGSGIQTADLIAGR